MLTPASGPRSPNPALRCFAAGWGRAEFASWGRRRATGASAPAELRPPQNPRRVLGTPVRSFSRRFYQRAKRRAPRDRLQIPARCQPATHAFVRGVRDHRQPFQVAGIGVRGRYSMVHQPVSLHPDRRGTGAWRRRRSPPPPAPRRQRPQWRSRTAPACSPHRIGWRGPLRGCAARPACAHAGLGAPRPQAGAAPRRGRAEFASRGRAALRNFAAFRADFARRQSGATPARCSPPWRCVGSYSWLPLRSYFCVPRVLIFTLTANAAGPRISLGGSCQSAMRQDARGRNAYSPLAANVPGGAHAVSVRTPGRPDFQAVVPRRHRPSPRATGARGISPLNGAEGGLRLWASGAACLHFWDFGSAGGLGPVLPVFLEGGGERVRRQQDFAALEVDERRVIVDRAGAEKAHPVQPASRLPVHAQRPGRKRPLRTGFISAVPCWPMMVQSARPGSCVRRHPNHEPLLPGPDLSSHGFQTKV